MKTLKSAANTLRSNARLVIFVLITVVTVLLAGCAITYQASAISDSQRKILNYSIQYYNECVNGGSSDLTIGDNKDYEGNQILTDDELELVKKWQPMYVKAIENNEDVGITWQMLAAIHKRESGLSNISSNHEGGVGCDNTNGGGCPDIFPNGEMNDSEMQAAFDYMVGELVNKVKAYIDGGVLDSEDDVKKMFFAYNGQATAYIRQGESLGFSSEEAKNGEGSPYVMNKADDQRNPEKNSSWCQLVPAWQCPANKDHGAYVIYKGLGGSVGSASSTSATKATDSGPYIWVGDSRTEGMSEAISEANNTWVAKVGAGYSWFESEAAAKVTAELTADSTIVFNFGVNDLGNIDKYIAKLNELAEGDWSKAKKIIVMSVNPVIDGKNNASNAEIENFNSKMKQGISSKISFLDTYSDLKDSLTDSDYDSEGLHYTNEVYQEIYDMVRGTGEEETTCGGDTLEGEVGTAYSIAQLAVRVATGADSESGDLGKRIRLPRADPSSTWDPNLWADVDDEEAQEYIKIVNEVCRKVGNNGTHSNCATASCTQGVAHVVRATVDPDFHMIGPGDARTYMENSDRWEYVKTISGDAILDESDLEPGDILAATNDQHTAMYVGNDLIRKKYPTSNANTYQAHSSIIQYPYLEYNERAGYEYEVFRYKGKSGTTTNPYIDPWKFLNGDSDYVLGYN